MVLQHIMQHVMGNMADHDRVHFHMHCDLWKSDLNMPFMKSNELTSRHVIYKFYKIMQSYTDMDISIGNIMLNIIHTKMPTLGSGWSSNRGCRNRVILTLDQWIASKRCTISMFNNDKICLARALVVAMAHWNATNHNDINSDEAKYLKRVRDFRKCEQCEKALELHHAAGIPER